MTENNIRGFLRRAILVYGLEEKAAYTLLKMAGGLIPPEQQKAFAAQAVSKSKARFKVEQAKQNAPVGGSVPQAAPAKVAPVINADELKEKTPPAAPVINADELKEKTPPAESVKSADGERWYRPPPPAVSNEEQRTIDSMRKYQGDLPPEERERQAEQAWNQTALNNAKARGQESDPRIVADAKNRKGSTIAKPQSEDDENKQYAKNFAAKTDAAVKATRSGPVAQEGTPEYAQQVEDRRNQASNNLVSTPAAPAKTVASTPAVPADRTNYGDKPYDPADEKALVENIQRRQDKETALNQAIDEKERSKAPINANNLAQKSTPSGFDISPQTQAAIEAPKLQYNPGAASPVTPPVVAEAPTTPPVAPPVVAEAPTTPPVTPPVINANNLVAPAAPTTPPARPAAPPVAPVTPPAVAKYQARTIAPVEAPKGIWENMNENLNEPYDAGQSIAAFRQALPSWKQFNNFMNRPLIGPDTRLSDDKTTTVAYDSPHTPPVTPPVINANNLVAPAVKTSPLGTPPREDAAAPVTTAATRRMGATL